MIHGAVTPYTIIMYPLDPFIPPLPRSHPWTAIGQPYFILPQRKKLKDVLLLEKMHKSHH